MVSQHFPFVSLLMMLLFLHHPVLIVASLAQTPFDLSQLLTLLVQFVPLPVLFAVAGTSVGRFLAQQHFPKLVNDIIAFVFVLGAAVIDAIVSHQVSGTSTVLNIVSIISGVFTLLVAGPLSSLKPYMAWLNFLQNTVFNVVKPPTATQPTAATTRVTNAYTPSSPAGPAPLLYSTKSRPTPQTTNNGGEDTSG